MKGSTHFPSRAGSGARVALLTTYFRFFDGVFPDSYRETQAENARSLAAEIESAGFEVINFGLTDSEAKAHEHAQLLSDAAPNVLLLLPLMACPATHALPVALALQIPTVICQWLKQAEFHDDYDEITATEDSTLLGAAMLTSGLLQHGLRFASVVHRRGESGGELYGALRGAIATSPAQPRRIGVVGAPLEGYVDVEVGADDLTEFGMVRVPITSDRIISNLPELQSSSVAEEAEWFEAAGAQFAADAESLARDLALGAALEAIATFDKLDAVVLNCHDALFRRGQHVGIPACLAGSRLASSDRPVTCTGDVSTAVALVIAREFTPDVLYCEPFTIAYESGEILLSSCGIGTLSTAASEPAPSVCKNLGYPGIADAGGRLWFGFREGPATIIAFVPGTLGEPAHLIWTVGRSSGRSLRSMHGPNAIVTLDSTDPVSVMAKWVEHGPAHHVALAGADLSVELRTMDRLGDFRLIEVR